MTQTIRVRFRDRYCPLLSMRRDAGEQFNPTRALIDEFTVSAAILFSLADGDINAFFHEIGDRLFGRPIFHVNRNAQGGTETGQVILESEGYLFHLKGYVAHRVHAHNRIFRATIRCNLTRFLAHHAGRSLEDVRAMPYQQALSRNADVATQIAEKTLNNADNYLHDRGAIIRPPYEPEPTIDRTRQWLNVYLNHVEAFLVDQFRACSSIQLTRLDWVSVAKAEIYWELATENAVAWAYDATTAMWASTARDTLRASRGSGQNCQWLIADIGNKVDVAIYAKTPTRVRFEVRFKGRIRENARVPRRRDGGAIDAVLIGLIRAAPAKMEFYWRELTQVTPRSSPTSELIDMILKLSSLPVGELRRDIVSLIWTHGVVEPTAVGGIAPQGQIELLARAGIVERARPARRQRVRYRLVGAYLAALRAAHQMLLEEDRARREN
jgi:hypothetical protein